ncbi:MAG TPA: DUF4352 domain-containing protein [Chloroflexota bacterium]|nr:DUF4352 domain-containing protein [Chloroflexota bacterium]
MGRAGYLGCLVVLGVVMLSVSCLAVFGATGALTAERGRGGAGAFAPPRPAPTQAGVVPSPEPRRTVGEIAAGSGTPSPAEPTVAPSTASATRPALSTPTPSRTGPENGIAQRLEREAVGGGLKLKALGAAKTIQGDRSVLAVYIRIENDGAQVIRVDPASFKLVDRAGNRYLVTRGVEQMFPPVELRPRSAPGRPGELTEGNLTFEIPRTAQGLALLYELPSGGQPLRIPLPPEFG